MVLFYLRPSTNYLYSIAINSRHEFVAVGSEKTILFSFDGINWSLFDLKDINYNDLRSVVVGDKNRFVIVGSANTLLDLLHNLLIC